MTENGQQARDGLTSSALAMGRAGALELAGIMAKEHRGAIYLHYSTSDEWTKLES